MTIYLELYRFVSWRECPEIEEDGCKGFEPDLPEGTNCILLAQIGWSGTGSGPYDALYAVRWPKDVPELPSMRAVPASLAKLLESRHTYPPALAIAQNVRFRKEAAHWSAAEAVEKFTNALRDELDNQRHRGYFLAKAIRDEIGYKRAGKYYWIVGYRPPSKKQPEAQAAWVSRDFFVYQDPVTDFDVDTEWLKARFPIPQAKDTLGKDTA
jgi:hypothetical protein